MIAIDVTAFIDVYRDYAVSNTPLFFLRKLKESEIPAQLAKMYSGDEILEALHVSLVSEPLTRTDYVSPYVFLMALARNLDGQYLKSVERLEGQERFDWFKYLWRVLMDSYSPLIVTSLDTPKIGSYTTLVQNSSAEYLPIEHAGTGR
jgi:hypothetical protein